MFVNQISLHEALKMAIKGKEVKISFPSPGGVEMGPE